MKQINKQKKKTISTTKLSSTTLPPISTTPPPADLKQHNTSRPQATHVRHHLHLSATIGQHCPPSSSSKKEVEMTEVQEWAMTDSELLADNTKIIFFDFYDINDLLNENEIMSMKNDLCLLESNINKC
jgi:hypothetical protein